MTSPLRLRTAVVAAATTLLCACAVNDGASWSAPQPVLPTPATHTLQSLPAPGDNISVAVYNFADQTGQFKPTEGVQTLSRAVTQGATSILVKALQESGRGRWFTVVERERLDNLLRERAVIREMRASYLGETKLNRQALPPLLFAGVILEGGIIGYDTNTKSGGIGARFLGIGGSTKYREDTVTVYLRAVSVKTGEVLLTVSVRKSIASIGLDANAFRYVAFKDLLELEGGVATNEPDALALQQAIESAVYGLIIEGAGRDLWCMSTQPEFGEKLLRQYYARRDNIEPEAVELVRRTDGSTITGACTPGYVQARAPAAPAHRGDAPQLSARPAQPAARPTGPAQPAPPIPTLNTLDTTNVTAQPNKGGE